MWPQWHVKDPSHPDKSAGGMLHLNTHKLLTAWSRSGVPTLSRHSVGPYQENELMQLTWECSATVVSARWATVDQSWRKVWNQSAWADFHLIKKKKILKRRQGMHCRTFPQYPCSEEKATTRDRVLQPQQQRHSLFLNETKMHRQCAGPLDLCRKESDAPGIHQFPNYGWNSWRQHGITGLMSS